MAAAVSGYDFARYSYTILDSAEFSSFTRAPQHNPLTASVDELRSAFEAFQVSSKPEITSKRITQFMHYTHQLHTYISGVEPSLCSSLKLEKNCLLFIHIGMYEPLTVDNLLFGKETIEAFEARPKKAQDRFLYQKLKEVFFQGLEVLIIQLANDKELLTIKNVLIPFTETIGKPYALLVFENEGVAILSAGVGALKTKLLQALPQDTLLTTFAEIRALGRLLTKVLPRFLDQEPFLKKKKDQFFASLQVTCFVEDPQELAVIALELSDEYFAVKECGNKQRQVVKSVPPPITPKNLANQLLRLFPEDAPLTILEEILFLGRFLIKVSPNSLESEPFLKRKKEQFLASLATTDFAKNSPALAVILSKIKGEQCVDNGQKKAVQASNLAADSKLPTA